MGAPVEPPHLLRDLKELRLPSIAAQWERLADQARRKRQPHASYLAELVRQEVVDREERRIKRRVAEARLPVLKTLDAFDFDAGHGLDRDDVLELFDCEFVTARSNVVLMGGVGTGKTHLAIALGLACCQRSHRVRFTTAAELTNQLVEAKLAGRLGRALDRMARYDVVILDSCDAPSYVPQTAGIRLGTGIDGSDAAHNSWWIEVVRGTRARRGWTRRHATRRMSRPFRRAGARVRAHRAWRRDRRPSTDLWSRRWHVRASG